jgi:hypothetical protein
MKRLILRVILLVAAGAALLLGGPWAVRPLLSPPQGLHPIGWTYTQLIRDRYPVHFIDPAWLNNDMYWSLGETTARIAVVAAFGGIVAFALVRNIRHESPAD